MLNKSISRRSMFKGLAVLSVATIPLKLMAQTAPKVKVVVSEIGNNHGHEFTMTFEALVKGGEMNYSIQGHAGHPHFIRITPAMLTKLSQGNTVSLVTSTDVGHSHQVTLKVVES